jgi:predicted MFS family arabinose efflux permease
VALSWRWIFVLNIPIGLAAIILAILYAPATRHSTETRIPDLIGGVLVILGIGVGLAVPNLTAVATADLAPAQTSTGSAVVQMCRQVGAILGVAFLVITVDSSGLTRNSLPRVADAWWLAAGITVIGALSCLPLLKRPRRNPSAVPTPATVPAGR